jgi:hypothetical protein
MQGGNVNSDDIKNVQKLLTVFGYPTTVDGVWGSNTRKAISKAIADKYPTEVPKVLVKDYASLTSVLGSPGSPMTSAGECLLPIPFILAWDESKTITSFRCHIRLQDIMTHLFREAFEFYGREDFVRLRLNVFGGCYNDRNMTNGSKKSVHAWGAAVDLDPANNRYEWSSDKAFFARDAYKEWWQIVEKHGAVSLGKRINKDWMHFQFCGV